MVMSKISLFCGKSESQLKKKKYSTFTLSFVPTSKLMQKKKKTFIINIIN